MQQDMELDDASIATVLKILLEGDVYRCRSPIDRSGIDVSRLVSKQDLRYLNYSQTTTPHLYWGKRVSGQAGGHYRPA